MEIINGDILNFFSSIPDALPIYEAFAEKLFSRYDDVKISVKKTQISFSNKYIFAFVWRPRRKGKGLPDNFIVGFLLPERSESERFEFVAETYPGRWVHHIVVSDESEIDEELFEFIDRSYDFGFR